MASFTKLSSKSQRVQIRHKGRYVSEIFLRRKEARRQAIEAERQIDRDEAPNRSRIARRTTFGDLIDLHIDDMCEIGKAPLRSKTAPIEMLRRQLGECNMGALDRERLIRDGAAQGRVRSRPASVSA